MMAVLWAIAVLATIAGLYAVGRLWKLQGELRQLKRDQYYASSRLKQIPDEITNAVQPLRLHLAAVAEGGAVPRDMIMDGRLYQEIGAAEARQEWERNVREGSDRVVFVDVRTPKEYVARRVPGARLVPLDELDRRYKQDVPAQADKVLVYCAAGERSRFACDFLSQRGYTNLYHINEGLQGWAGPTEGEAPVSLVQIEKRAAAPGP